MSFFVNNEVKCMVVGSLVPTQRSFKGLLLLSRSPLAKPIINPSYSDFCPRDLPVSSESAVSPMPREVIGMAGGQLDLVNFAKLILYADFGGDQG